MVESTHSAGFWPGLLDPLRQAGSRLAEWVAPRSEAAEERDGYEITLELPGVKPEDVEVSAHDGALTVKGEKRAERTESGKSWFFSEREYGSFQRSFRLPADADDAGITADFADGVLRLRIARRAETAKKARRIEIASR